VYIGFTINAKPSAHAELDRDLAKH